MKSTGTIRYGQTSNYIILDCCPELSKLYRHLFYLEVYKTRKLNKPLYGGHITIVRNENVPDKTLWNKYEGEIVEFDYFPPIGHNRYYWWLSVSCDRLYDIRIELGLPKEPLCPWHLTFGNELIKPVDYDERPFD